ncbi:MAG: hypothetical protein IJZ80_06830 [Clostridia bacterium]|nr:hypothetical protein [Clostridia bacterium]
MKKMIALLLALLMVASTVVAVSAEGTGAETPTAPKNIQVQTRAHENENKEIVSYDIRFLATVHSTEGKEIGFEVDAFFLDQNGETLETKKVTYSKKENEETDANMAGDSVYTSVIAAGEELTAEDLIIEEDDDPAIGIFAAVISGVPANLDVVFEINTYVDYEGGTNRSSDFTVQYIDGVVVNMTDMSGTQSVYTQDFTTEMTSAKALEAAGITKPYGQNMNLTLAGDKLNIPHTAWKSSDKTSYYFGLVPRDPFTKMYTKETEVLTDDSVYNYMLEMDIDISQLSVLNFIFNGSPDSESDTNPLRPKSIWVSLRVPTVQTADAQGNITWNGKFQNGLISTLAATKENIFVRTGTYTDAGADAMVYNDTRNALDIEDEAKNVALKLNIVVNNTHAEGCQVGVFINETLVQSSVVAGTYRVTANSYVSMWAQETVATIDNVKVYELANDYTPTDWDPDNKVGSLPTVTEDDEKYSQNFNDIDPLEACNVTFPYTFQGDATSIGKNSPTKCHGGFPVTINDAGQLQVNKHAWHDNADYFAHLVSANEVAAADVYKFEADLDITALSAFGFMINNNVDKSLTDNYTEYQQEMLFVSFRNLTDTQSSTKKAGLHFRIAHYNDKGVQAGSQDFYIGASAPALKAKFTMIVDSTYTYEEKDATTGETITKTGCKIYLFLDNKLIDTVVYDNTYDVKKNSSIGIWAQDTEVTIDNIKFTGVKKNS